MTGENLKNFAIGAAVLVGVAGAVYLFFKGRQAVSAVAGAAKDAGGYLFGVNDSSSLGSDLHALLNQPPARNPDGKPAYWDYAQAEKTRHALYAAKRGEFIRGYGVD